MKLRHWLAAGIPALIGLSGMILFQILFAPLPVVNIRFDVGIILAFLGVLLSGACVFGLLIQFKTETRAFARLEEERRSQNESRHRFFRRLDHELKNPLTALQAALANLDNAADNEFSKPTLSGARIQVTRLARLTTDLRKLAGLDNRSLELEKIDPGQLVNEVASAALESPGYRNRQVSVKVDHIPWPLPSITADRDLLFLALYNLLDNALKFTELDDAVELRAGEDGRNLVIEVADSGPGISAEDLSSIFEELYRGSNARGVEGSGLGLPLARQIIIRHGGTITVRSRPEPPRGTVFTVRLPLLQN